MRVVARTEAEIQTNGATVRGWLVDISSSGMAIESTVPVQLAVGAAATVRIPVLEENGVLPLDGRVRHSSGQRHGIELNDWGRIFKETA